MNEAKRRLNTGTLAIQTTYPEAVMDLLILYDLANADRFEQNKGYLYVHFDWDTMSLALYFWLHAAQTCGLIERWIQ
jgi:hypothetical protein